MPQKTTPPTSQYTRVILGFDCSEKKKKIASAKLLLGWVSRQARPKPLTGKQLVKHGDDNGGARVGTSSRPRRQAKRGCCRTATPQPGALVELLSR